MADDVSQPPVPSGPPATGSAYAFAVGPGADGGRAVVITEVRRAGDRCESRHIVVAESDLAGFLGGLRAAADALATPAGAGRACPVAEARGRHPKAYASWLPADDLRLLARHRQGAGVADLAREFGRNEGAIRSRLVRLGAAVPAGPGGSATPGAAGRGLESRGLV